MYGIARAATSPELALFDTPGKKTRFYSAIHTPHVIYTARVNQVITAWDGLLQITYDGGSGTLVDVLPDMLMYIGNNPGKHGVGTVRVRGIDSTHIFIDQSSGVKVMDNQYLTIVDDFRLRQRHIKIDGDTVKMDGTVTYSDQHENPDPTPIMGAHRVVEMTGASVDVSFDFSQSYVIDGSGVDSFEISAPTASAIDDNTSPTPVITFDTFGWHNVYCNVIADNGKEFFGVRYVFVWDKDHLPPRVKVSNPSGNVNTGGWQFEIEMYRNADLDTIAEGALVILFSVDWWGDTEESIGPVAGSENIEAVGWISSPEHINQNPERGLVHFTVQGPQYWMSKIASYPDGVQFVASTPTDWTQFQTLTVDKGVWHFLHWRTTTTRILDFFPSGDTRYTGEVSSLAENLWGQLQEMCALQILSRPGFNALGQLFIQINPNLIPTADRDFATVMDIGKSDWIDELDFDYLPLDEVCQVNLSGIAVDGAGGALAYFANAPGHTYNHYGTPDILDRLLTNSQSDLITLAGLYFSWRNNNLPPIPITLKANNRLIDIFPNSKCTTTIDAADNVRGIGYDGGLMPESITVNFDDDTGRATRTVEFRTETFESLAVKETVPGSGDVSTLPPFNFPPLPSFPPIPGGIPPTSENPPNKILVHDPISGFIYSPNGGAGWYTVNAGLTTAQYQTVNKFVVCPNGAVYAACTYNFGVFNADSFLAYTPKAGTAWTILYDGAGLAALTGNSATVIASLAVNPLALEQIVFTPSFGGTNVRTYIGNHSAFIAGANSGLNIGASFAEMTYGKGGWLMTATNQYDLFSANMAAITRGYGGSVTAIFDSGNCSRHIRAGTTGKTFHYQGAAALISTGDDNCNTVVNAVGEAMINGQWHFSNGMASDLTGMFLMSRKDTGTPIKSSDGGATWVTNGVSYLPPTIEIKYLYVSGDALDSCWLAGEYRVWYSKNFGTLWVDISGNLHTINAFLAIDGIAVLP